MTDDDALAIVQGRSGTMYDPNVVEAFLELLPRLPRIHDNNDSPVALSAFSDIARTPPTPSHYNAPTHSQDIAAEVLFLGSLAHSLGGHFPVTDAADLVASHLSRVIPYDLLVFFALDTTQDLLVPKHIVGRVDDVLVKGITIPMGQRLSGWVAANRQLILNSDPALDLVETANEISPRLTSALVTPLLTEGSLLGVLALYAHQANAFTDTHARTIDALSRHVARVLNDALQFERLTRAQLRDPLTGLPNATQFAALASDASWSGLGDAPITVIAIAIDVCDNQFVVSSRERVVSVSESLTGCLRAGDLLFQMTDDTFAAVLLQTDSAAATGILSRLAGELGSSLKAEGRHFGIGAASLPQESKTLQTAFECAMARAHASVATSCMNSQG